MQKKFLTSLLFLLILNLLVKPFWLLGIDLSVQNITGTADYGIYFTLLNFSFLLNILLDPGITAFNNKNIAQHNFLLPKYLPSLLVVKLMLSAVYFFTTLFMASLLGYSDIKLHLLAFLALNQILASMILYLRSNISALHRFTADSILSVLDRALMILFCSILIWGGITREPFRVEWFVYLQTAAYAITVMVAYFLNKTPLKASTLRFRWPFLFAIIRQSYPFALLSILMTLYSRVDAVMLERLHPDGAIAAGIYAAAYRILDAFNIIALLFATLLLPIFSRMLKHKEDVRPLVNLSWPLLQIPVLIIAAAVFTYRHKIMESLYSGIPSAHGDVLGWLMFTYIAIGNVYIFGTLLTASGKLRLLNIIATSCVILNILMNFVLIPRFGIMGAVAATLFTQFAAGSLHNYFSYKIFRFKVSLVVVLKFLLFVTILVFSFCNLHQLWEIWPANMMLLIIFNLIFAVTLRLLNLKQLLKIFKSTQ